MKRTRCSQSCDAVDESCLYKAMILVFEQMFEGKDLTIASSCELLRTSADVARAVFDAMCNVHSLERAQAVAVVSALQGKNVFITGGAGTGKSHVTKMIRDELFALKGKVAVQCCGSTALAANNIGGCTIQRMLFMRPYRVPDLRVGYYPDAWESEYEVVIPPVAPGMESSNEDQMEQRFTLRAYTSRELIELNGGATNTNHEEQMADDEDAVNDGDKFFLERFSKPRAIELSMFEVVLLDEVSMVSDYTLQLFHNSFKEAHTFVFKLIQEYREMIEELCNKSYFEDFIDAFCNIDDSQEDLYGMFATDKENIPYLKIINKMNFEEVLKLEHRMKSTITHDNPFHGALQMICVGDFAQLPPVINGKEKDALAERRISKYAFQSEVWNKFITPIPVVLTQVKRTSHPKYVSLLTTLRSGKQIRLDELLEITRPSNHPSPFLQLKGGVEEESLNYEDDMYIFPRRKVITQNKWNKKPISAKNQMSQPCVDNWNGLCFRKMQTTIWNLVSLVTADPKDTNGNAKPPPSSILLRVGSIIQITSNIPYSFMGYKGSKRVLANGTIATFCGLCIPRHELNPNDPRYGDDYSKWYARLPPEQQVNEDLLSTDPTSDDGKQLLVHPGSCILISIKENGTNHYLRVPRMSRKKRVVRQVQRRLSEVDDPNATPIFPGSLYTRVQVVYNPTISQFKVALAHGITVHKSQGLTIYNEFAVHIKDVFEGGQLYVSLSRAHDPMTMRVDYNEWDYKATNWEEQVAEIAGELITAKIPNEVLEYHKKIESTSLPVYARF